MTFDPDDIDPNWKVTDEFEYLAAIEYALGRERATQLQRNGDITEDEIRQVLSACYGQSGNERDFIKMANPDDYDGETGSVFYSLRGSPPKGYALYIPEKKQLNFYNTNGERVDELFNARVVENR